jgi:hypothetical protein
MYSDVRSYPAKPLPAPEPAGYQPPFVDEPLLTQALPEQAAFVETYNAVGSPRIALFVNRTLEGQIVPTRPGRVTSGVEVTRESSGPVKIESTKGRVDAWGRPIDQNTERFESSGPARVTDRTEHVTGPSDSDERNARRIDYDAVEKTLTGWMRANGRVTIVSPTLTEAERRDLQQGRQNILQQLSKEGTHVLIQVQARPTDQLPNGMRLVAEAIDTATGESLGSDVVDVQPPLDKPMINDSTRFLARRLMSDITRTWQAPRPERRDARDAAPPAARDPERAPVPSPMPVPAPQGVPPSTQP